MSAEKILCIDDSVDICELLKLHLSAEGYCVESAHNGGDALKLITTFKPDIILLDVLLPDNDGLSMLKTIQDQHKGMPVIMISGRGEDIDKIIGIEAGADDYLAKPFNSRELSARIKMVLKRYNIGGINNTQSPENSTEDVINFDHWVLDRKQYQVFDGQGQSANFTTNEFLLLERLAMTPYQVLSREQLFEIWSDQGLDKYDRAVDVQITRIRSKLNDDPKNPKYIKTVRGIGYMFTGKDDKE